MPHRQLMEERLRFLNIDSDTISELRNAKDIIEPAIEEMLDQFYSHMMEEPELQNLFLDDEVVKRARSAQKSHWMEALFDGKYDNAYYERTSQIGLAHARIGLTPNWYIGGYNQMLCQFIELISEKCAESGQPATRLIQSVSKIIFLDMDLVLHCYLDAKDSAMRRMLQHATDFRTEMWSSSDDLNSTAEQIKITAELLSADVLKIGTSSTHDGKKGEISARVNELIAQAEQLNRQSAKLDSSLRKLPLSEKLYLPKAGTFERLKSMIFGNR